MNEKQLFGAAAVAVAARLRRLPAQKAKNKLGVTRRAPRIPNEASRRRRRPANEEKNRCVKIPKKKTSFISFTNPFLSVPSFASPPLSFLGGFTLFHRHCNSNIRIFFVCPNPTFSARVDFSVCSVHCYVSGCPDKVKLLKIHLAQSI